MFTLGLGITGAQAQPCAKDKYPHFEPWHIITHPHFGEIKNLSWHVPIEWVKDINDSTYIVPHPDEKDFCKEVSDTIHDKSGTVKTTIERATSESGLDIIIQKTFKQNGTTNWNIVPTYYKKY